MAPKKHDYRLITRRALVKSLGSTALLLRPSPLHGASLLFGAINEPVNGSAPVDPPLPFSEVRLVPHYPARSPLQDVLRLVEPGYDEYVTERYAFALEGILGRWSQAFKLGDLSVLAQSFSPSLEACSLVTVKETSVRAGEGMEISRREFTHAMTMGKDSHLERVRAWLGVLRVESAEFDITSIEELAAAPLTVRVDVRYDIVASSEGQRREGRIGLWRMDWSRDASQVESAPGPDLSPESWKVVRWGAGTETVSRASGPVFIDVTHAALGGAASYETQLLKGADYWRTVLDGACGIDVYGNNGVSVGDYDNDGLDDIYVCQPQGLPNRLYRNRGDGSFEDVTDKAGVGVLDNTACALFADFRNNGLQDLLVVSGSGPLLFLNQGSGTFAVKRDAFQFRQPPQGTFTHAAVADYDRDGRLDIYFCLYSYYLGLDQYHYPAPYFDARNGPPNFLFHNEGDATFVDATEAAGLNAENDRYSFACAWSESPSSNLPDLYVVNDFGRNNLYRNNGSGKFSPISTGARVEDVGAGMSACWADYDNDGNQDIYVANMWSAAGQRVSQQPSFHDKSSRAVRELYQRHARGNALYRNLGGGAFENVSEQAGVEMGRWAWCSDFWDFDHDGYPDLYVTNGYISAPEQGGFKKQDGLARRRGDLGSFFWRQVVGKSPDDSTPSLLYERGWNALNELIRSDSSWSGFERNVFFANNRDGTFSEISGIAGLDFTEDGRSFALADLDHDGRLEVILKNRNAPQVRILHNAMKDLGDSVAFRLRGTRSNRDGIGAAITVKTGRLRQTRYLQAGSGFLAQHSKEVFFGLGSAANTNKEALRVSIRWPSGLNQQLENVPRNNRIYLEEGVSSFVAAPFGSPSATYSKAGPRVAPEELPSSTETWLIDPLKAPEFALPDLGGSLKTLKSLRGSFALLHFCATTSPIYKDQLMLLKQHSAVFAASRLSVVAIHVDDEENVGQARSSAARYGLPFPVLFATGEVAGIFNLIYRYLFDRRRDLAIPTSFLVDPTGMIVKVYQGALDPKGLLEDVRAMPIAPSERIRRALPFAGTLYQGAFLRNDFTYGVAMFQHGYLDQAAELFQQVIVDKPDNAEGYYNLGTLNLRRNDFDQARQYLRKSLQIRPNYPEAWNNLGMVAAQEGHPEEAIEDFQHALLLRAVYPTALLNLGNVYRRQGEVDKARETLKRALDLEPDDPEANYSLGMFYAQQNESGPASEYLQKAVTLRPGYAEALNNLGVLFVRKQDYVSAEDKFKTCIRLDPAFEQSYVNLARLYVLQHDKERARRALEDLLHLQPQSAIAKQGLEMLNSVP